MRLYTVTITPDDGTGAQTVVKLRVDGAHSRITQLQLNAAADEGLSATQLPPINLELLLAAVLPASMPATHAIRGSRSGTVADLSGAGGPVSDEPPAATTRSRPGRKSTSDQGRSARKSKAGGGRPATKVAAAAKPAATSARAPGMAAKGGTGRVYRTLPDDFAGVYGQAKSVAGVADHYQVPRHTVNGWVRTARQRGLIAPGRSRQGN